MRLVLASNNAKKLAELQALFAGAGARTRGAGQRWASPRPRSRTTPSSRTPWPRRGMRRSASGLRGDRRRLGPVRRRTRRRAGRALGASTPASCRRPTIARAQRRAQDAANNALLLRAHAGPHRPARALRQHAGRAAPRRRPRAADRHRPLGGDVAATRRAAAAASATTRWCGSLRSVPASPNSTRRARTRISHRALAAAQMRALMREAWSLG